MANLDDDVPSRARTASSILLMSSSTFLLRWQLFDRHLAARTDLHFQFATPQQAHPDQWISVCLVNEDGAHFAVPLDLGLITVENALAAVGQCETFDSLPA